ncbi:hypothetical protein J3R82DRAFT_7644 [Butyriboletus roseoflavus]|nr:hypothetical protein J3R82DRAFT_7644 [Butyriboletus roseoflavus]
MHDGDHSNLSSLPNKMVPPETLELVLGHISRDDLVPILTTNSLFHQVAARVLYRTLTDIPPKRTLRLIKSLARNDLYPPFVRRFDLEWNENILTGNFLRLLHRALQRLTHLSYLGLEFSATDNPSNLAWILQGCTFSLRVFTTSMRCEPLLARFFETQHNLVEVCLRGFNPVHTFPLPPEALPRLRHFRTVLSSPHVTANFVRGRPIESVSMSLYPGDATTSLDALLLSTRPLRRLTVMSFDIGPPAALITEISKRLPALEALHAVVLVRHSNHATPSLSEFKALRYLTFMAPGSFSSDNESEIATLWHKACPTLKTIILPKGIVWGYVDGQWVSLQDVP